MDLLTVSTLVIWKLDDSDERFCQLSCVWAVLVEEYFGGIYLHQVACNDKAQYLTRCLIQVMKDGPQKYLYFDLLFSFYFQKFKEN